MKVSCRFLIFDELLGYAYSSGFKPFCRKSAFEPITHTLKWVLADAAFKASMIFVEYRVDPSCEMHNGVNFICLSKFLDFHDFE